jgi:hypothetical protein
MAEKVKVLTPKIRALLLDTIVQGGLNALSDVKLTQDSTLFEGVKTTMRDDLFRRMLRIFVDAKSRIIVICKKLMLGLQGFNVDEKEKTEALIVGKSFFYLNLIMIVIK